MKDKCKVADETFKAVAVAANATCEGCAGEHSGPLCVSLEDCVSSLRFDDTDVIWVRDDSRDCTFAGTA